MKFNHKSIKAILLSAVLLAGGMNVQAQTLNEGQQVAGVVAAEQINPTTVELCLSDGNRITIDFYGENIFRMFRDANGGIIRDPQPMEGYPDAQILVDNPRQEVSSLTVKEDGRTYTIISSKIAIEVCKATGQIKVTDLTTGKVAFEEAEIGRAHV